MVNLRRSIGAMAAALGLAAIVAPAGPATAHAGPDGATAAEVSFVGSGGVVLSGTVLAPERPAGRRPAMVLVQGAGNRGRAALRGEAEAFARHGIVTLSYDKRTVGYSLFHRDYSVLADDALAGLRLLLSRANVDPDRTGVWAASEGAFVAPLAAYRATEVTFLIVVGAVGVTPAAQTAWQWGEYLNHAGVSGSLPRTMRTAVPILIGAGLFPEATFDPAPAWARVRQPVLAQWGELDHDAVPDQSSQIIRSALERGGNTDHTIRFVPGVRHSLHRTANGGFDHLDDLPSDYGDYEAAWIDGLPHARPATTTGPAPAPDRAAPMATPLAWYATPWLQLAAFVLLVVAFAGYPLTAAARRLRGRNLHGPSLHGPGLHGPGLHGPSLHGPSLHGPGLRGGSGVPPVRWAARSLAAAGLTTTLGALTYLFFMMATAANVVGPTVAGRPVAWLVLQLLAVATVGATATTARAWRRHRRTTSRAGHLRLGLLVAGGLLFLPWATHWGLLIP